MTDLQPGRELDALVAEKVVGQVRVGECPLDIDGCGGKYEPQIGQWPCLPPYSTDMAAAWQAVNAMLDRGLEYTAEGEGKKTKEHRWQFGPFRSNGYPTDFGEGDTAAHAICLAALKAIDSGLL